MIFHAKSLFNLGKVKILYFQDSCHDTLVILEKCFTYDLLCFSYHIKSLESVSDVILYDFQDSCHDFHST